MSVATLPCIMYALAYMSSYNRFDVMDAINGREVANVYINM